MFGGKNLNFSEREKFEFLGEYREKALLWALPRLNLGILGATLSKIQISAADAASFVFD
jgi:uncharacterized protein YueI